LYDFIEALDKDWKPSGRNVVKNNKLHFTRKSRIYSTNWFLSLV